MNYLEEQQSNLQLDFIDYELGKQWDSHVLISSLRQEIQRYLPSDLDYDPQDLEHQVLFRLTTFDPYSIDDDIVRNVVQEQYELLKERLSDVSSEIIQYIFRGLTGKSKDLNRYSRLILERDVQGQLVARNACVSLPVEFKKIEDQDVIKLFTEDLHYIHSSRVKGDTFGFFFEGDGIPWAVETTEPSTTAKQYKRDALLANGIHPDKAIELTRLYTLPGSPRNAISIIDSEVTKYYKQTDTEALFTTTMPTYAKTKSSTIAGGLNKVLLVKDLYHYFIRKEFGGGYRYELVNRTYLKNSPRIAFIKSHPNFPLLPSVEVFMTIKETSLAPLQPLKEKVIYAKNRD